MDLSFTYSAYEKIIRGFQNKNYSFPDFPEFIKSQSSNSCLILRHDIDYDVRKAYELALIENKLGVKSTFFFLIRTYNYNVFCPEETMWIKKIISMGHKLGLHFDAREYPIETPIDELNTHIDRECTVLEQWFQTSVDAISFHNPYPHLLQNNENIALPRIHTYLPNLIKKIQYLSDSGAQWKYGHPLSSNAFKENQCLQFLTHPLWWGSEHESIQKILARYTNIKNMTFMQMIVDNCKSVTAEDLKKNYE